jgi:hypothetical protein
MKVFLVDIWTMMLPSALLLPLYAWTFYKVYVGSRFNIVLLMIVLLITANVGSIVEGIGQYGVMLHHLHDDSDTIFRWDCISGVGLTVLNLCFNEAHWILAVFYFKMAKNMPRVLANNPADPVKPYTALNRIGIVLNAFFPLAQGISFVLACYFIYKKGEKQWVDVVSSVTAICSYCC